MLKVVRKKVNICEYEVTYVIAAISFKNPIELNYIDSLFDRYFVCLAVNNYKPNKTRLLSYLQFYTACI